MHTCVYVCRNVIPKHKTMRLTVCGSFTHTHRYATRQARAVATLGNRGCGGGSELFPPHLISQKRDVKPTELFSLDGWSTIFQKARQVHVKHLVMRKKTNRTTGASVTATCQPQEPWFSDCHGVPETGRNPSLCSQWAKLWSQPQANRFALNLVIAADSKFYL